MGQEEKTKVVLNKFEGGKHIQTARAELEQEHPGEDWSKLRFMVYDAVNLGMIKNLATRRYETTEYGKKVANAN